MSEEIKGVEDHEEVDENAVRQLTINMDGVSTDFEPMPVGVYSAHIKDATYVEKSAKSGKPYIKIVFEVDEEGYEERVLFSNYSLSKNALWKFAKLLKAVGYDLPDGEMNVDLDDLEGMPCMLSVTTEEYQGKIKNPIADVLPAEY